MAAQSNLVGPGGRLFAEPQPGRDEAAFRINNNSSQYYNSKYYLLHKSQVQPIPPARNNVPMQLNLKDFVGPQVINAIQAAGKITFQSVGDTGAAKVSKQQSMATALAHEASVADSMVAEVNAGGPDAPAFFFHLGDVIYNFGEAQYYYDQFYEPFRAYDRPIFAIPGNHDGAVFGQSPSTPQIPTLDAFLANFCAAAPGPSRDAAGLVRSVMTQPAVYFTLEAPFVSIIGLYSNVLEGPGVISSQNGHFPISDDQLTFLKSELGRLKPDRDAGKRAVVIALHHPPLSADAKHAGSTGAQADIDTICKAVGLYPDLVLSGHAHLYQRFTRRIAGKETPYITAGCGGFSATAPQMPLGHAPITVGDHTLEIDPIVKFGYLNITVVPGASLRVSFRSPTGGAVTELDTVTVDLQTGKIATGSAPSQGAGKALGTKKPAGKPPQPVKPAGKIVAGGAASRPPAKGLGKKAPQPIGKKKPKPKAAKGKGGRK